MRGVCWKIAMDRRPLCALSRPCGKIYAMLDSWNIEVVDDEMAHVFRAMTGAQRLKIANDMFRSARSMIASHLATEHPEWDELRLQQEVARRLSHGAV